MYKPECAVKKMKNSFQKYMSFIERNSNKQNYHTEGILNELFKKPKKRRKIIKRHSNFRKQVTLWTDENNNKIRADLKTPTLHKAARWAKTINNRMNKQINRILLKMKVSKKDEF